MCQGGHHADAQSRPRSWRWIGRGALASLAALIALAVQPALPALAGTWSAPVQPGRAAARWRRTRAGPWRPAGPSPPPRHHPRAGVHQPGRKTWQATDLGPGGDQPHGGQHPVMALSLAVMLAANAVSPRP